MSISAGMLLTASRLGHRIFDSNPGAYDVVVPKAPDTAVSVLRDDDMVEMTWDLQTAFLTIGSVSYTKAFLHPRLESPVIEGVLATAMAVFSAW
jgi:hypothetical protein